MDKKTLAVVGGGAAGLIAAIAAARNCSADIIIFEKMNRVGKKLLATGNGRCNFSNKNAGAAKYHGGIEFAAAILRKFSVGDTVAFFDELGIIAREETDGRLYPYSGQASSVLDVLRNEAVRLGVQLVTDTEITSISHKNNGFILQGNQKSVIKTNAVIICTGGCASAQLGSDGSGFKLFKALGHTMTELSPALVQLKADKTAVKGLSGIKINGTARCLVNGKCMETISGEILFTDYGISGPPILELSKYYDNNTVIEIDFMPEYTQSDLLEILLCRSKKLSHLTFEDFFTGMLNKKIGYCIARKAGIEKMSKPVKSVEKQTLEKTAKSIKCYKIDITGTNGFRNAQVTKGGVRTDEFNPTTLESLKIKKLYGAGEVLDVFGNCGGYNLQWAWSSGYTAGLEAAKGLYD